MLHLNDNGAIHRHIGAEEWCRCQAVCCRCRPSVVEYRVGGRETTFYYCCKHPTDRTDWSVVGDVHTWNG